MKSLNILSIISFILFGCHEDPIQRKVSRVIANESSANVEILGYSISELIETVNIDFGEVNEKQELCQTELGNTNCSLLTGLDIRWYDVADSLVVIFNKNRIGSYCEYLGSCSLNDRGLLTLPLFLENGEHNTGYIKSIVDDTEIYTFTITEQDYENSILVED